MSVFGKTKVSAHQAQKDKLLEEMLQHEPETSEYDAALSAYERLCKIENESKRSFSWDSVVLGGASLLSVGFVAAVEQRHVLSQKALGFVMKPKSYG